MSKKKQDDEVDEILKRIDAKYQTILELKGELEKHRKGETEFDRIMTVMIAQKLIEMGQDSRAKSWIIDTDDNFPF